MFSSLPIHYVLSVSWVPSLGGPRKGGSRLRGLVSSLWVTTFSEPVLFTLQAEAQAGRASHLPVLSVSSLRGCLKPSE